VLLHLYEVVAYSVSGSIPPPRLSVDRVDFLNGLGLLSIVLIRMLRLIGVDFRLVGGGTLDAEARTLGSGRGQSLRRS